MVESLNSSRSRVFKRFKITPKGIKGSGHLRINPKSLDETFTTPPPAKAQQGSFEVTAILVNPDNIKVFIIRKTIIFK